jgi:hypothetical protein
VFCMKSEDQCGTVHDKIVNPCNIIKSFDHSEAILRLKSFECNIDLVVWTTVRNSSDLPSHCGKSARKNIYYLVEIFSYSVRLV